MELNEYQKRAMTTLKQSTCDVSHVLFGLAAEAGEVAGKATKAVRDLDVPPHEMPHDPEVAVAILAEVGDVLWYVAAVCRAFGTTLEDVARDNLAKLRSRADRGVIQGSGDDR